MRKRVGTKVYDTDTAKFLCHTPDGDLYRKHFGTYFMWNNNNPKDISREEAMKYNSFFSEQEEYEPETRVSRKHCTIMVSESELKLITELSEKACTSNHAFIMSLVEEYIRNHSEKS